MATTLRVGITKLASNIIVEERVLERELNGYREYEQRVRYRFVPYIW